MKLFAIPLAVFKPERLNTTAVDLPKHTLETENERVRIYRVKIAAGESVPSHTHASGWLEVIVSGAKPGSPAWHPSGQNLPLSEGEVVEIEPK